MTTLEKYIQVFCNTMGISKEQTVGLEYNAIPEWDSIGHLSLVADIEEIFEIMMNPDDIIELSSFDKGIEILGRYDVKF